MEYVSREASRVSAELIAVLPESLAEAALAALKGK